MLEEQSLAVAIAKLEVKLDAIIQEMARFREDFSLRLDEKASKSTQLDHETRIRRLEMWGLTAIGFLTALQMLIGYYVTIKFK